MPVDWSRYPATWPETARRIKEAAGWVCVECGLQCYRPGEPCEDRRRVLTVAHVDPDPMNDAENNLLALCSACHLRRDARHHADNARETRRRRRIERGQLALTEGGGR